MQTDLDVQIDVQSDVQIDAQEQYIRRAVEALLKKGRYATNKYLWPIRESAIRSAVKWCLKNPISERSVSEKPLET